MLCVYLGVVMKVLFGNGVADARGSQAGATFSRNKGGAYVRQRVKGTNPNTALQAEVRSNLSLLATYWGQTLTQVQRDGWTVFGENFPVTDRFGNVIILTGQQSFTRLNARLLSAGLAIIATAPMDQNVTDLTSASMTAAAGTSAVTITFDPSPLPSGDYLQVRFSPQVSPGKSQAKNQLRLVIPGNEEEESPVSLGSEFEAYWSQNLTAGQKIFAEVNTLRASNGAVDTPLVLSCIVGS